MNKQVKVLIKGSTFVIVLAALPGCNLLEKFMGKGKQEVAAPQEENKTVDTKPQTAQREEQTGPVLLTINGKKVLQESEFVKSLTQMLQANPYLRGAGIDSLPASIKKKFFDELVKQKVIIENAQKSNLFESADFKKAYAEMMGLVQDSMTVQFFEKEVFDTIKVSDSEVEEHYNKNKEQFVKVAGGVLVAGVKFDSAEAATAFYNKVKDNPGDFENMAKDEKDGKFKSFGRISKETKDFSASLIPAPVKDAVFALSSYPAVKQVKSGKEHWVVVASDKKETEFFDLDEIKPQIRGMLKNNKFKEELDKKLHDIKGHMNITINEDYFKDKEVNENNDSTPVAQVERKAEKTTKTAAKITATPVAATTA
jgi:peptidyl-prolyl cis-trans isomerase C